MKGLDQTRLMREETKRRRAKSKGSPLLGKLAELRAISNRAESEKERRDAGRAVRDHIRNAPQEIIVELCHEGERAREEVDAAIETLRAAGRHWEAVAQEWADVRAALFEGPGQDAPRTWRLPTNPVRAFLDRLPKRKSLPVYMPGEAETSGVPLPVPPAIAGQWEEDPGATEFELVPTTMRRRVLSRR
jgi:hypothetical protein